MGFNKRGPGKGKIDFSSIDHYNVGNIEVLDYIKVKMPAEMFAGFLLGNSIKYLSRFLYKKEPIGDLEKAAVYSKWLLEFVKDNEEDLKWMFPES